MPFPDFIGIGAQKAGTTWLYHQIRKHPDVWLPPLKELHYFDRQEPKRLINNVFQNDSKGRTARTLFIRMLLLRQPTWLFKFLFHNRQKTSHYPSLFTPGIEDICGEITPAYGRLSFQEVQHVASIMPDCKVIYLVRNPVERAWSHINMFKRVRKIKASISEKNLPDYKLERMVKNSMPHTTLYNWESSFGSDKVFVGFFDQIKDDPQGFLSSIYSFLSIDTNYSENTKDLNIPQNKGDYDKMPLDVEQRLSKLFMSEIQEVHQRFNNPYTKEWLERANTIINQK